MKGTTLVCGSAEVGQVHPASAWLLHFHSAHCGQRACLVSEAESGLLSESGETLMVICGTDRIDAVSWRRVRTGQIS
jgi:hypothetical protein